MIIPKEYGGLAFSALAVSSVCSKLASHSGPLSITVMVPNSLGPGELLSHYGTQIQKDHYLPYYEVFCGYVFEITQGAWRQEANFKGSKFVFRAF